jgi:hypothetical protein
MSCTADPLEGASFYRGEHGACAFQAAKCGVVIDDVSAADGVHGDVSLEARRK